MAEKPHAMQFLKFLGLKQQVLPSFFAVQVTNQTWVVSFIINRGSCGWYWLTSCFNDFFSVDDDMNSCQTHLGWPRGWCQCHVHIGSPHICWRVHENQDLVHFQWHQIISCCHVHDQHLLVLVVVESRLSDCKGTRKQPSISKKTKRLYNIKRKHSNISTQKAGLVAIRISQHGNFSRGQ